MVQNSLIHISKCTAWVYVYQGVNNTSVCVGIGGWMYTAFLEWVLGMLQEDLICYSVCGAAEVVLITCGLWLWGNLASSFSMSV